MRQLGNGYIHGFALGEREVVDGTDTRTVGVETESYISIGNQLSGKRDDKRTLLERWKDGVD